jgi:hypothetical protein
VFAAVGSVRMGDQRKDIEFKIDLEVEALVALEQARAMPHGSKRAEALKKAGALQNAASRNVSYSASAAGLQRRSPNLSTRGAGENRAIS